MQLGQPKGSLCKGHAGRMIEPEVGGNWSVPGSSPDGQAVRSAGGEVCMDPVALEQFARGMLL